VSEAEMTVRLSAEIAEWSAGMERLSRIIGELVTPAVMKLGAALAEMYRTWPGMPYTGPSLWGPEQMIGDGLSSHL
jgi:hypothetical protein